MYCKHLSTTDKEIFLIKKSVFSACFEELLSFVFLFGMYYLNYRFIGGSVILNITISILFLIGTLYMVNKKKYECTLGEAIEKLTALKEGK